MKPIKTETQWPLVVGVAPKLLQVSRWQVKEWQWIGLDLSDSLTLDSSLNDRVQTSIEIDQQIEIDAQSLIKETLVLEIFKDERLDYRFNLSSKQPKLFLALSFLETTAPPKLVQLTASQSVAACYMDTDYLVLSMDMPMAIQVWLEAFMAKHGELIDVKKKKYKGAGRSSGK